jgi:hypothetical protein
MAKTRPAKPRPKKSATAPARKPARPAKRAVEAVEDDDEAMLESEGEGDGESDGERGVMCRSCGKRPGRPTAILGQMTQAELCPQCTALRKERIRLNRAAARGLRSSRLF